jgi:hypothetical protein
LRHFYIYYIKLSTSYVWRWDRDELINNLSHFLIIFYHDTEKLRKTWFFFFFTDVNGHHYWIDATNALASDPSAWDAFRTSDNKVFPISDGSSWHNGVGPDNGNIQPLCIWIPTFFSYKLDDIACYSPSTSIKHICEKPKP